MLAFHSDPKIKTKYLKRVRAHRAADEIIHGYYWEDGKGCAVGCTIHGNSHAKYEDELGIPKELAQLEDAIFEGLKNGEAKHFPEMFLESVKPGADLSKVWNAFAVWMLLDEKHGVLRFAKGAGIEAVKTVAALHQCVLDGESPPTKEWAAARAAAWDAARAAAWDAAGIAAGIAARAAAWDAAWDAAGIATRAAAWAAEGDAARAAFWKAAKDKLLSLLKNTSKTT